MELVPRRHHSAISLLALFDGDWEFVEKGFAVFDLLIDDDAIEALFAVEKLFCEIDGEFCHHRYGEKLFLCFLLCVFDALGDFDFLFAGKQRHLAHLLEVHSNRVIQNIMLAGLGLFLFRFFLLSLEVINFFRIEDIDLEVL